MGTNKKTHSKTTLLPAIREGERIDVIYVDVLIEEVKFIIDYDLIIGNGLGLIELTCAFIDDEGNRKCIDDRAGIIFLTEIELEADSRYAALLFAAFDGMDLPVESFSPCELESNSIKLVMGKNGGILDVLPFSSDETFEYYVYSD